MNNDSKISTLGEINLIKIIEELVFKKTGKNLVSDDSFFFNLKEEKIGNLTFNIHLFIPELNFDVMQELKDMLLFRESVIKRTRAFFLVKLDVKENEADNFIILKLMHFRDLEKEKSEFGENLDKINWLIYKEIFKIKKKPYNFEI